MQSASAVHNALRGRVLATPFPCVGARSALRQGTYGLALYDELGTPSSTRALWTDLANCWSRPEIAAARFTTYIASFREPQAVSEREFESLLWQQLQLLHDLDAAHHAWDPRVSSDPDDPGFCFSIVGRACFVVGLHPRASRMARRFPLPTLCFNPHQQFERLRASGRYERFRNSVRVRDIAWQGSVNPMLRDHGEVSEAAQYSGRRTSPSWRCPLRVHADHGA